MFLVMKKIHNNKFLLKYLKFSETIVIYFYLKLKKISNKIFSITFKWNKMNKWIILLKLK